MKFKFYNITFGQLVVIWITGLILAFGLFFYGADAYSGGGKYLTMMLLILGFLPFYTLGWRANRKNKANEMVE